MIWRKATGIIDSLSEISKNKLQIVFSLILIAGKSVNFNKLRRNNVLVNLLIKITVKLKQKRVTKKSWEPVHRSAFGRKFCSKYTQKNPPEIIFKRAWWPLGGVKIWKWILYFMTVDETWMHYLHQPKTKEQPATSARKFMATDF